MKKTFLVFAVTLMLCGTVVWSAHIGAETALAIRNKGYVTVKGFAKQEITADLGIFEAAVHAENPDLKLAYERLADDRRLLRGFLKKYDIPEGEIEPYPVSVTEKFKITDRGYATDEFVHFKLAQDFKIESRGVAGKKLEVLATVVVREEHVLKIVGTLHHMMGCTGDNGTRDPRHE